MDDGGQDRRDTEGGWEKRTPRRPAEQRADKNTTTTATGRARKKVKKRKKGEDAQEAAGREEEERRQQEESKERRSEIVMYRCERARQHAAKTLRWERVGRVVEYPEDRRNTTAGKTKT